MLFQKSLCHDHMTKLKLVCIVVKSAPISTSASDVATARTTLPTSSKSSTLTSSPGSDFTTTQTGVFATLLAGDYVQFEINFLYCVLSFALFDYVQHECYGLDVRLYCFHLGDRQKKTLYKNLTQVIAASMKTFEGFHARTR